MNVQIINNSRHPLPEYHSDQAAGLDLRANIYEPITLGPLDQAMVPTGIHMALPAGYEGQVRPRSGLAAKHGITLVNAPGTIDADYRGEIAAIVINLSNTPYTINDGDRIAQLVIAKHERVQWQPVENLEESARSAGGFGHTGTK